MRTKYVILISISLVLHELSMAQPTPNVDTVIYTPRNVTVEDVVKYIGDDYTTYEADSIDDSFLADYVGAILIGSSSRSYNCHGYAWNVIEGGDSVWINGLYDSTYYEYGLLPYWVGENASYIETQNISEATKIVYEISQQTNQIDHSAIPTSDSDTVISKWGDGPLMKHHVENCQWKFSQYTPRFYKLIVDNIIGPSLICNQTSYSFIPLIASTTVDWETSSKLDIVSNSSSHITVEPHSTTDYGHYELITANIKTRYENIDEGEDVIIDIAIRNKTNLHVSNPPSNVQIHVPVEPIYGEVEAMVWASSDPGEETYVWQLAGGEIVSQDGAEIVLIADCPSRKGITLRVKAINDCGETGYTIRNVDVDCDGGINPLGINPNPADDYVEFSINLNDLESYQFVENFEYEIKIYNSINILLFDAVNSDSNLVVNTSNFENGVYFVHLIFNGKVYSKKLIISHR